MKLYLNGWEADLVEKALREVASREDEDSEHAQKLLQRIDTCKQCQKPHNQKPT